MCLFDCKCKNLNRLGENIKTKHKETVKQQKSFENNNKNINTGYPALDPTANKYLSGSGWEIMILCLFYVFLEAVYVFVLCLYVFFRL